MNKHIKRILWAAVILIVLIGLYLFNRQFTFNFASLGILLLAVCSLTCLAYRKFTKKNGLNTAANAYGLLCSLIVVAFGMLCLVTINNYFSPRQEVFSNGDHHVVQIEGLNIVNPKGYVLAANSPEALFDNEATTGRVTVESVSDSTVTLRLTPDFQRVIYREWYSAARAIDTLEMQNALPTIGKGEKLLIAVADDRKPGGTDTLEFSTRFDLIEAPAKWQKWKDPVDTMRYFINGHESDTHTYLRRGLPMSQVIAGLKADSMRIDLDNLHIIRPRAFIRGTSLSELKTDKYADERFAFEMHGSSSSKVKAISTDGVTWHSVNPAYNRGHKDQLITLKKDTCYYSIGYGGQKSTSFKFTGRGDTLSIIFRMPMMRYLSPNPDRPDNLVLLTQSLNLKPNGADKSFGMLPDNVMLFDFFNHADNYNRIYPKQLAYTTGPSKEKLVVGVYDFHRPQAVGHENLSNGMALTNTQAMGQDNVSWRVSIQDFKANNALYQPTYIKISILALTLILAVILLWGNVRLDRHSGRNLRPMFSTVEFVAYMVTIYLVTLRWFLLWRSAVFPPVEHVSPYDFYGMFQKAQNQHYFILLLIVFVACVIFVKFLAMAGGWSWLVKKWQKLGIWSKFKTWWGKTRVATKIALTVALAFVYAIVQFVPSLVGMTWLGILCPVLIYMGVTMLIHSSGSLSYNSPLGNTDDEILATLSRRSRVFIADIANSLITAAALTLVDSGYGILFLTFTVFWLLWELYDYAYIPDITLSDGTVLKTWNKFAIAIIPLLLICYVLLIAKYKEIFKYMAFGGIPQFLVVGVVGACIGLAVFLVIYGARLRQSWFKAIGWVLVPFILFGGTAAGFNWYLENNAQHTVERIRVHFYDPDHAMISIGQNETHKEYNATQRRYIQAALNHSIIGEYNDRGSDISLVGEGGTGYFKMQPHSPVGAMWGAQLSDISPVRYLIAEHSKALGVIIVLMFLLMLSAGVRQVKHHSFARCVLVQVPLLLMVQTLLIWMANTQRFIFLGQDLPMISINSSLAIAFYFSLVTLWLAVMFYEKSTEYQLNVPYDNQQTVHWRLNRESWTDFLIVTFVFLACVFLGYFATSKVHTEGFMPVEAMREVDRLINGDDDGEAQAEIATEASVEEGEDSEGDVAIVEDLSLNGLFRRFQQANRKNYLPKGKDRWRDADHKWHDSPMPTDLATVARIVTDFNEARADSIAMLFGDNVLAKNMWANFVETGVMHNNRNNVMHVRLKSNGYLSIEIFNRFYNQKLPDPHARQWKGSLVASGSGGEAMVGTFRQGGATVRVLPGEWMRNGRATALATGKAQIEGEGMILMLDDTLNVAAQAPSGYAVAGFENRIPDTDYLARNVKVNGAQTFVYPLGQQFYWARNIAQEAAARKTEIKREIGDDELPANFDHDIALTISPKLTEKIYDKFKNGLLDKSSAKDKNHKAVIVADGDGRIVAMVDYKKHFTLDPNEHKRISQISDSLYMIGRMGGSTARYYFGNVNLMALRYGPGSTQKPLTWTAVASGIDYPWKDLKIVAYENIERESKKFVIRQFNGHRFIPNHPFKPLRNPDEQDGRQLSLSDYMTYSSNVYNAIMAYIGSWPKDHYDESFVSISRNVDGKHLFATYRNRGEYLESFPILLDKRNNRIRLNAHPIGKGEAWLYNSLLQDNFSQLFDIERSIDEAGSHSFFEESSELNVDKNFINNKSSKRRIQSSNSFIEPSALLAEARSEKSDSTSSIYFMEMAIRSTAIGAQNVWNITPLQMAQSFGRMASRNQEYNLTVLDSSLVKSSYKEFEGQSEGYLDARPEQFIGLNGVLTKGTGKSAGMKNGKVKAADGNEYYIYAKTGTIGSAIDSDHHRFAVIITDRNLAEEDGHDDLEDMKFYVLYFTYTSSHLIGKEGPRSSPTEYGEIIQMVVDSDEFGAYMKSEKEKE